MNWIRSFTISSLILFASLPALAQDDFVRKEAEQRFHEGTALLDQGKNEQARAKFLQAYATSKVPNVVFNLARAEHLTGRRLEAARHYREYLRIADPKKVTSRERAKIDGWLTQLRERLGRIVVTAPRGSIVSIDGERIEEADLEGGVEVSPGSHQIRANGWGKDKTVESQAPAGVVTEVAFSFAEPAPVHDVEPKVNVVPVAHLPDTSTPVRTQGETHWGTGQTVGVIAAGAGVVALGLGGAFLVGKGASSDRIATLEGDISNHGVVCSGRSIVSACSELQSKRDERDQRAAFGVSFMIGGAVALAAGVVTFFVWPKERAAHSSVRVRPVVGANQNGLELRF